MFQFPRQKSNLSFNGNKNEKLLLSFFKCERKKKLKISSFLHTKKVYNIKDEKCVDKFLKNFFFLPFVNLSTQVHTESVFSKLISHLSDLPFVVWNAQVSLSSFHISKWEKWFSIYGSWSIHENIQSLFKVRKKKFFFSSEILLIHRK